MLIYANAVTQIWKRLVPLVGSWTEAWSSHVALRAWGNLQPTDSTCTFLLLMFTARWSLEITGIFFFFMFCYLYIFFLSGGVNPFGFGVMKTEHNFSLSRGYTVVTKTLSLALPESARVLLLFFCSVPLLSAQAGSHCGITILLCKCFAFIEPEMHFCIKL